MEENLVAKIGIYKVYADRYQYILYETTKEKVLEDGKILKGGYPSYHVSLSGLIEEICNREIKRKVMGSKDLNGLVDSLEELKKHINRLLAPLKRLEDGR